MSGNIFGTLFKLTTFGESHGPAIGGVIDGCPAGVNILGRLVHPNKQVPFQLPYPSAKMVTHLLLPSVHDRGAP